MPDNTLSTLAQIRTKVRRLTRSPSASQITDDEINNYINNFVIYDFPEHLRSNAMRTTLTFYTQPYIDSYATNTVDPLHPLYNFKNKYISIHDPVYIAGYKSMYSQSRDQFYGMYPNVTALANQATGNGALFNFVGVLSAKPILANNVLFSSVDINNNGLQLYDDGNGILTGTGNGTINYITGAYVLNFATAPKNGTYIYSQTVPYQPTRPLALLFYQNTFYVRPVPDQPYAINVEAYMRPSELLVANEMPDLSENWQYIAYGAAKKIFEDRMDTDSLQVILPEFKQQELLSLRRTIVQNSNQRTATIYTEGSPSATGLGWGATWGNW